jgi:hypothetical protein
MQSEEAAEKPGLFVLRRELEASASRISFLDSGWL